MSRDVHSCSHWLGPHTPPHVFGLIYEGALLVSNDRRHLLVTTLVSHLVDECLEKDDGTGEDSVNGEEYVIGLYRDDAVRMLPLVFILKQCHPMNVSHF
jgi:hypothetical protein